MIKKTFLLLSLMACCLATSAQAEKLALTSLLQDVSPDDSIGINQLIQKIENADQNDEQKAEQFLQLGEFLVANYQYELADQVLSRCLELAKDKKVITEATFQSGMSLMYRDIRLTSLSYFKNALSGYSDLGDSLGM